MTIIHHLLARLLRRPSGDGAPMETEPVEIESVEVDPDPVPIGGEDRVVATFEVVTSGSSAEVKGDLVAPDGSRTGLGFEREERTPFEERWRAGHAFGRDSAVGTWRVVVGAGGVSEEREFEVRAEEGLRLSRIDGFELSPDPIDEGGRLTVSGRLETMTGKDDWGGLPGRTVALLFRPDDMLARREVARVVTGRSGRFDATVTATESGFWSAEFRRAAEDRVRSTAARSAEVRSTVRAAGARTTITYSASPKSGRRGRKATHTGKLLVRVEPAGGPPGGIRCPSSASASGSTRRARAPTLCRGRRRRVPTAGSPCGRRCRRRATGRFASTRRRRRSAGRASHRSAGSPRPEPPIPARVTPTG
ncbi:hypothetical protein [Microbispora sp. H10830]|uniref:hypothetical protein n=1 Tax=Microbispora sp. H10830 TaxID=2729109 RepID=UPI0015FFA5A5|nr:hypothetical protein [Microbispora sp. H10830]